MINCLLIDDEPLALQLLGDFVQKTPFLNLVGKFEDPFQALPVIESGGVDLIFLDIRMPDITGIEFFRSLVSKPEVIFTTAYSEYAIDGFELKAMDYLLKPVSYEKFVSAGNRVKEYLHRKAGGQTEQREYFFINVAHKLQKLYYRDILYLEGYKDYTKIYLVNATAPILILHSLKYFEDILDRNEFIRIHRSYIVPIGKVDTVSRKAVKIESAVLPVSDNYREAFFEVVDRLAK
ncbi:MAG: response regulator transcription factor [Chitinophagaceae bacterium]|nr:MAG: response regulator transcription factor [Chitinophagaceae bacterium]